MRGFDGATVRGHEGLTVRRCDGATVRGHEGLTMRGFFACVKF
mgnify:FL=1